MTNTGEIRVCPHCNNRDSVSDPHRELRLGQIKLLNLRIRDDETDYQYQCTSCDAKWWNVETDLGRVNENLQVNGRYIPKRNHQPPF